ncbi:hypothetical protein D1164_05060 [Mariniphaga sediminis]|uniref:Uncharacterized protein n=3 Tax=Mariniphaga sediminis TaxID=1628158 RepID=A0A399D4E5_9BACT|nr:hypothetical protein D1164_05060 [Mariniphaga sediminis]
MKKMAMLFVGLLFIGGMVNGQEITIKEVFGGQQFYQNGKKLTMGQLVKTMEGNELAYNEIKKAQSTYTLGAIVSGAGGFMIGYPLGTALAGGDPNWVLAGIGAGLAVVSIPIAKKYNKQSQSAVKLYNEGLKKETGFVKPELYFGSTENGIGFRLYF